MAVLRIVVTANRIDEAAAFVGLPRDSDNPRVVVGEKPGTHLIDSQHPWRRVRARAGAGHEPVDDRDPLGHAQIQTTARYAHLTRDSVSASKIADSICANILTGESGQDAA